MKKSIIHTIAIGGCLGLTAGVTSYLGDSQPLLSWAALALGTVAIISLIVE